MIYLDQRYVRDALFNRGFDRSNRLATMRVGEMGAGACTKSSTPPQDHSAHAMTSNVYRQLFYSMQCDARLRNAHCGRHAYMCICTLLTVRHMQMSMHVLQCGSQLVGAMLATRLDGTMRYV